MQARSSRPCGLSITKRMLALHFFGCRQHFRDYAVDILRRSAVINDARPQTELPAQGCIGQINVTPLDDAFENGGVPSIKFVLR